MKLLVQQLDEALAELSCRQVAVATVVILSLIFTVFKEKGGIRWASLVHASISGYLSLGCILATFYHNSSLSPSLCDGPLTNVHRLLPAITLGYGLFDIFEATTKSLSKDFLLHGVATLAVMMFFCENDIGQIISPFLTMEISTVHLAFLKANFSDSTVGIHLGLFVISFFLFRLILCPYLWWGIVRVLFFSEESQAATDCLPLNFQYYWLLIGLTFNLLNGFWGVKIILKVLRKVRGSETMKEGNSLKES